MARKACLNSVTAKICWSHPVWPAFRMSLQGNKIMGRKAKNYLWQSVIGLGFFSGLWTAVGVDPEQVIISALSAVIDKAWPDPNIRYLFIILPTLLLLASVYGAYRNGRMLGIVGVIIAYGAGLLLLSATGLALLLLVAALVCGWIASDRRLTRRLVGR